MLYYLQHFLLTTLQKYLAGSKSTLGVTKVVLELVWVHLLQPTEFPGGT